MRATHALIGLAMAALRALCALGQSFPATMPLGNKPGNPIQNMPPGERLISTFGKRPVFSKGGRGGLPGTANATVFR